MHIQKICMYINMILSQGNQLCSLYTLWELSLLSCCYTHYETISFEMKLVDFYHGEEATQKKKGEGNVVNFKLF